MSFKIKVLMITARADFGGGPEHLRKIIDELSNRIDIYVACPNDYPYWGIYSDVVSAGRMLQIPHRSFSLQPLLKLVNFCRHNKIDLVHSHGKGAGIYSRMISALTGTPVVHTPHGLHLERYGILARWMYLTIERYFSWPFRKLIFVSPSEQDNAQVKYKIWRDKGVVITNGVDDVDAVLVAQWRDEVRKELAIDSSVTVVGTVCRFDPVKNMQEAVAVAHVRRDMIFVWVGDGEGRAAVEKIIKEHNVSNITLLGARSDVLRILSACDIYLATSSREALGIAILEGMSVGLPVVASKVVGHVSVVKDRCNGFLYTLGKPEEAAAYLSQLSDTDLRQKMGAESRTLQQEHYSATVMANAIYSEYLKIAETRTP